MKVVSVALLLFLATPALAQGLDSKHSPYPDPSETTTTTMPGSTTTSGVGGTGSTPPAATPVPGSPTFTG